MSEELNRCECGGEAELRPYLPAGWDGSDRAILSCVHCVACGARSAPFASIKAACASWNRPAVAALTAERDALRARLKTTEQQLEAMTGSAQKMLDRVLYYEDQLCFSPPRQWALPEGATTGAVEPERVVDVMKERDAALARLAAAEGDRDLWAHAANEWADAATNGEQQIKNIRDGLTTFEAALDQLGQDFAHCRFVQPAIAPRAEGEAEDANPTCYVCKRRTSADRAKRGDMCIVCEMNEDEQSAMDGMMGG